MLPHRTLGLLVLGMSVFAVAGCGDDSAEAAAPAGGGGGGGGGGGPPPAMVRMAPVAMESVRETRSVTGNLRAKRRSEIATIEGGRVEGIEFDEAQTVKEGDVLVRLDDRRIAQSRAETEAERATAEANVAQAQAELERVKADLQSRESAAQRAQGAVSEIDLRQARTAVTVAEAQVNAAQKQVDAIDTRLSLLDVRQGDLEIKAPFDGQILMRMVEVGEYVSAGQAIGVIATSDAFEAVLDAPESLDASSVLAADPATVSLTLDASGVELTPTDIRVVDDVDARSRRYLVVLDVVPAEGQTLTSGSSVTAQLPAGGEAERLVVPYNAIRRGTQGSYVYLGLSQGAGGPAAVPQPVTVAYKSGDNAVLSDAPAGPLQPGTPVVVEGAERINFPGQPLQDVASAGGEAEPSSRNPEAAE